MTEQGSTAPIPVTELEPAAVPAVRPHNPWPVILALSITLLSWSSAFVGIRYAVKEFDPGALALFRNTITALVMLAAALAFKRREFSRPTRADVLRLVAAGVIGIALYQFSLISGERSVDAGTASLIINTSPIFTALLALFLLREHLGLRGWAGVLLGFGGAALLVLQGRGGVEPRLGALFVLVASIAQAVSFIIQKPLLGRLGPFTVTAWVALFGAFSVAAYGPALWRDLQQISPAAILAGVYLGIVPSAIGNLTWAYALSKLPAGRASAALYLVAPITLLLSSLLLGERPALLGLVGGGIVIASVVLVNLRVGARR